MLFPLALRFSSPFIFTNPELIERRLRRKEELKEQKLIQAGGSVHDGVIEIQGDHREVLLEELKKRGWAVKRVGG